MKFLLFIGTFLLIAPTLHAQNPRVTAGNPRTETYTYLKGGDSIRFSILGKDDTLQTTQFYRSGKIEKICWKQDSCFKYNILGQLTRKTFGLNKTQDIPNDSTFVFYKNGQIESKTTFQNNVTVNTTYDQEGTLMSTDITHDAPSVQYRIEKNGRNLSLSSSRTDTILDGEEPKIIEYDTVYFDGKRVFKTSIKENNDTQLGTQYYNLDGSLAETILPDSLELIEFKDNVDCYYGLKNRRGDTIVKPRFDHIETFNNQMWGAYSGKSLFLLDRKGAPISLFPPNITGVDNLYDISERFGWSENETDMVKMQNAAFLNANNYIYPDARLYAFSQGDKSGVVDGKGRTLLSPQFPHLTNQTLFGGTFFHFEEYEKDFKLKKSGFITKEGKPLFSSDAYKTVMYSQYKDYFFLCENPFQVRVGCTGQTSSNNSWVESYTNGNKMTNTFGLGKADGTVILPRKFSGIRYIGYSPFFITHLLSKGKNSNVQIQNDGIYDTRSKRWLLDSVGFQIKNQPQRGIEFFVVKQLSQGKMGIMDTTGHYVLPLAYDSIGIADETNGLFWVKKANKYQLFDLKNGKPNLHKAQYDFLSLQLFSANQNEVGENVPYFYAKKNNKWGIIDENDQTILPFDYDYAAKDEYSIGCLMVKNNQADYFTLSSLPNPMPDYYPHTSIFSSSNKTGSYTLVNNTDRFVIINDEGKVLVPPQYKLMRNANNKDREYLRIEDNAKRQKVVFLKTGTQYDFPFEYRIEWANPDCTAMIVKDSAEVSYGVVSTDGKLLMPCKNYGIAIGDNATSVFFVKQDTPNVKRDYFNGRVRISTYISSDSLNIEDNNWLMYDGKGTLLSNKPFRFPIEFLDGVGIGVKDGDFNLYKTDGSILSFFVKNTEGAPTSNSLVNYTVPKGFNNILKVDNADLYALFYNQGLTPTVILAKKTGEIVVNSGRYDGISKFYGNYALVSVAGKMGLIDTLGREVIALQDMRSYSGNLIDSLNLVNTTKYQKWLTRGKKGRCDCTDLPIQSDDNYKTNHPDSLAITPAQRLELWHLLLETIRKTSIKTASDVAIERVSSRASASFVDWIASRQHNNEYEHHKINVEANTMSFILEKSSYDSESRLRFHNFYRRNQRWESLTINELLNIQGEKRWQINDLITKKVKALKDQQIDCSNTAAFISVVENRFMLTSTGVDFYFNSTHYGDNFVVISFTWKELSPFLKMSF